MARLSPDWTTYSGGGRLVLVEVGRIGDGVTDKAGDRVIGSEGKGEIVNSGDGVTN
jgi:hypothetical protein